MLPFYIRTVAYSRRTISIIGALVIALLCIGGAYALSGPLPFHILAANAESTHDLLVSYAAKDSDSDGLPDWEEALYGTDPNNPHSVSPTLTDGQAVAQGLVKPKVATATSTPAVDASTIPGTTAGPSTLTDQFARALFSNYLTTRGNTTPTPTDIANFVETGVSQLVASDQTPDAFNAGEVRVAGQGPDALSTYAASMEQVLTANEPTEDKSEVEYLDDATAKNDTTALKKIAEIGKYYSAASQSMMKTSVPSELSTSHLALANSLARLGSDITDLSLYNSDPLRTFLGLKKYQDDAAAFSKALTNMYQVYTGENVFVGIGTPGSHFFATLKYAADSQSTKPTQ